MQKETSEATKVEALDNALDIIRYRRERRALAIEKHRRVTRQNVHEANRGLASFEADELALEEALPRLLVNANYIGDRANAFIDSGGIQESNLERLLRMPDIAHLLLEFYPNLPISLRCVNRAISSTPFVRNNLQVLARRHYLKFALMERFSCKIYNMICAILLDICDLVLPGGVAAASTTCQYISINELDYNNVLASTLTLLTEARSDPSNWILDKDGIRYDGPTLNEFVLRQMEDLNNLVRSHTAGDLDYMWDWIDGKVQYVKRNAFFITAVVTASYCCLVIGSYWRTGEPPPVETITKVAKQFYSAMISSCIPLLGVGVNFVASIFDGSLFRRTREAYVLLLETWRSFPPDVSLTTKERLEMCIVQPFVLAMERGLEAAKEVCQLTREIVQCIWNAVSSLVSDYVLIPLQEFIRLVKILVSNGFMATENQYRLELVPTHIHLHVE